MCDPRLRLSNYTPQYIRNIVILEQNSEVPHTAVHARGHRDESSNSGATVTYGESSLPTFDDLHVIPHLKADCDTRVHVEMHYMLL